MGFRLTNHTRPIEAGRPLFLKGHNRRHDTSLKRVFDLVVALIAIILFAPVMIILAVAIRLQDGHRALFYQVRFGQHGNTFHCYKLRTMVPDAAEQLEHLLATDPDAREEWEETQKLEHDPRVTPLGQFLRKTSLDELPQLFNVVMGDMSLVGPRPIVRDEVARYAENFEYYSSLRPGITGLWQVKGRSDTSYEDRVSLDVQYAKTRSFWGDIKIMILTVPAVFSSRGAR
ncbi:MAG: sugar transferase [Pseudomonadota bacterium]